jgi:hypothetical protein
VALAELERNLDDGAADGAAIVAGCATFNGELRLDTL